jgi:hypothetical protein
MGVHAPQALEIYEYDRLAAGDQDRFLDGLVKGAIDILVKQGHKDQAAKIGHMFAAKAPGGKESAGLVAFRAAIVHERDVDAKRYIEQPDATRLEVEDAMIEMFKSDGIQLPDSIFTVNRDFRARLPLKP